MSKSEWKAFECLPSIAQYIAIEKEEMFIKLQEDAEHVILSKARKELDQMKFIYNRGQQLTLDLFGEEDDRTKS